MQIIRETNHSKNFLNKKRLHSFQLKVCKLIKLMQSLKVQDQISQVSLPWKESIVPNIKASQTLPRHIYSAAITPYLQGVNSVLARLLMGWAQHQMEELDLTRSSSRSHFLQWTTRTIKMDFQYLTLNPNKIKVPRLVMFYKHRFSTHKIFLQKTLGSTILGCWK